MGPTTHTQFLEFSFEKTCEAESELESVRGATITRRVFYSGSA